MNLIIVAIGGGLGAVIRYILGIWIKDKTKERAIPTAMLVVNVVGAFGLGYFLSSFYGEIPVNAYDERPFLIIGIGFFGAFTTFSTFSVEAVTLMQKKKWGALTTYVLLSIGGSVLTFLIGFYLGL
ncbi:MULTISPECIES: fluoride efflux transporter CrcB [Bacillaceae]|uniref:Fluoride-specific ion channel FluC n=1 Tax=Evansella alkalicola TaxID=745819 RepID=A0ABS6K1G1_9BACI|nr:MULTISPECIES: fluoride efflux transporter CrcB [Bacillaceae]MBU9723764.1 fluoride efflux transporter CrcB [Bacillus alkalicola]